MEVKLLGMLTLVGSATVETNNLFSMESQVCIRNGLRINAVATLWLPSCVCWPRAYLLPLL